MTTSGEPILRVEKVRRTFGAVTAVAGLDLEVGEGQLFGLLGPNGAGKTTVIRMICGELPCDSGRILLRGRALRSDPAHRHLVGWCPQEIVIWKQLTCLEQLELVGQLYGVRRAVARRRAVDLLARLGLEEKRDTLGGTLSGGMQRRLNLALALVHDPPLVVLDEPGAGLDPATRVLVRGVVRSLARERTVLLTTHEMDEAERLCDRIAILDHGELLAEGTVDALRRRAGGEQFVELRFASPESSGVPSPAAAGAAGAGAAGAGAAVAASAGAASAGAAGRAAEQLAGLPGVRLHPRVDGLALACPDPAGVLPAVLQRLDAAGITPDEIRLRQPCLEDVFLTLTGEKVMS